MGFQTISAEVQRREVVPHRRRAVKAGLVCSAAQSTSSSSGSKVGLRLRKAGHRVLQALPQQRWGFIYKRWGTEFFKLLQQRWASSAKGGASSGKRERKKVAVKRRVLKRKKGNHESTKKRKVVLLVVQICSNQTLIIETRKTMSLHSP